MRWQVRLDDIPVHEARLYLVFNAPVVRRAVMTRAKELLAAGEERLAGLVQDFGLESSTAAYVDIDMGAVPDERFASANRRFESIVRALDKNFRIAAVSLEPRVVVEDRQKTKKKKGPASPVRLRKDAGQLASQLMRLERQQEVDALCAALNTFLLHNAEAAAQAFASVIESGHVLVARLVEDMDANPTDKRFDVRVGDGILFGLISIHEAMGHGNKARHAARRFLALVGNDPGLARAYGKHIAFARARLS
jgi:hypothetical protein